MEILKKNHFWLRRLHSFLGVAPIGIFLMEHLFTNSYALQGAKKYDEALAFLQGLPNLPFIEVVFIALPLIFHSLYGLWAVYIAKNNLLRYNYLRNWMFYLQRVTALITFVFVLWHVFTLRLQEMFTGIPLSYQSVAEIMQNPLIFAFYCIGLVSAVFHFANGFWAFLITWGITIGQSSQRASAWFSVGVFIIMVTVGLRALVAFRWGE